MWAYLLRRVVWGVVEVLLLIAVVFTLVRMSGDPVLLMLEGKGATEAEVAALRTKLGLDKPLYIQYCKYVIALLEGDLGESLFYHAPVSSIIAARAPATAELASVAIFVAVVLGVPIGLASALWAGRFIDHFGVFLAVLGQSIPGFWLGIMGMILFAIRLRWLPAGGYGTIQNFVMPALALAFFPLARLVRFTRSSVLETLGKDYIRTGRAKGLSEFRVVMKHALKNAALPIITLVGLLVGEALGGSVIMETVFSWPGIGRLSIQAVLARDLPLIQGIVLLVGFGYLAANLIVDVAYSSLDPRIVYT